MKLMFPVHGCICPVLSRRQCIPSVLSDFDPYSLFLTHYDVLWTLGRSETLGVRWHKCPLWTESLPDIYFLISSVIIFILTAVHCRNNLPWWSVMAVLAYGYGDMKLKSSLTLCSFGRIIIVFSILKLINTKNMVS